jgi:hypothetical protein
MTKGELEFAIRKALNLFDIWNDVACQFIKGDGYYYEMQSVIEDAVKLGAKIASEGMTTDLSEITEKYQSRL